MHYLKCIALLKQQLANLHEGQRTQVETSQAREIPDILNMVRIQLGSEVDPVINNSLDDLIVATIPLKDLDAKHLDHEIKDTLVSGIRDLHDAIAMKAFNYFKTHDFEVTNGIKTIMRDVVKVALKEGAI